MTPVTESIGVVPNQPKTPMRSLRVPDDLWGPAMAEAKRRGETLTDAIRRALREYVNGGLR